MQINEPEIRFEGFSGEWEQHKLGEITSSYSGGTPSVGNDSYYGGEIPFIRSGEINSNTTELFLTEEGFNNSSAKMVNEGDILYALYGATSGEVGLSQITGAINQAILAIKPNSGYAKHYISQWLRNNRKSIIDKFLQGGQGNLSGSIVKDLDIKHPTHEEQEKIGELLHVLDEIITINKQKLDGLRKLKKGYLQQMFPQIGETMPRVRFDGFTEPWEMRKLGEFVLSLKSGLSRMLSGEDIGLPVVRANNIVDGRLDMENNLKYWHIDDPQGAQTSNYLICKNDILINFINSESRTGTSAIVANNPARDTIYTTNILNLRTNEYAKPYFIFTMTFSKNYQDYISSITKPAVSQSSFTTVDFKDYIFRCPSIAEQTTIGNFFRNIDNQITTQFQKLEQLKQLKTAYLQKMLI